HFNLLAQLLADALQAFPYRRFVDARLLRQPRRAPAAVIPAIAQQAFAARQRQQRAGQPAALKVGPARLVLVQDRDVEPVVERQERDAARAPRVERDGDDDTAQPTGEAGR